MQICPFLIGFVQQKWFFFVLHFENEINTGIREWEYQFDTWSLPQVNVLFCAWSMLLFVICAYSEFKQKRSPFEPAGYKNAPL